MKRKHILLLLILVVAALMLSGCGVPREGVDVTQQAPQGFWQQIIVWPLAKALIFLNDLLTKVNFPYHWGFAIILFTVLVKVITLPLTITQIRGMQAQKDIQPKIQELQKKYKGDREKIAQEQMRLYQEAGVNPLSGCLPLLIQMPILIGLYAALVAIGPMLTGSQWFWIPDLSYPHYSEGLKWLSTNFQSGNYLLLVSYTVLPILLVASQFWMQKTMTPQSTDPQAQSMQQVSLMMTFMFGFFTLQVPAGLTLYWVTSNLLQMLQQWAFSRSGLSPTATTTPVSVGAGEQSASPASAASSPKSTKSTTNKASGKSKRK